MQEAFGVPKYDKEDDDAYFESLKFGKKHEPKETYEDIDSEDLAA